MILYLDASALVKRYITERGSEQVSDWLGRAEYAGTASISRVEVSAALAKAVRMSILQPDEGLIALTRFRAEWDQYVRLQVTEATIVRGDAMAWEYGLRGYDAAHLASALSWQDVLGERITLATYDRQLWETGKSAGLEILPESII